MVDFCCVQARLIVEIDGDVHSEKLQARYDANRGEILRGLGYKILRFGNEQVMSGVEQVLARILVELENSD